jgi:cyclopropane-fatty-acyl-phospholipid synthase
MIGLLPAPTPAAAERVIRRLFGRLRGPMAFRLWDGREVRVGAGAPVATAVIHSAETFRRLVRQPTPFTFAEAYVDGAIDLEGDLFALMTVANEVEELTLTARDRLAVLVDLWRR